MTVTLTLSPEVEGAIQQAARRSGQTAEETIAQALHTVFVPDAEDRLEADRAEQEPPNRSRRTGAAEQEPPNRSRRTGAAGLAARENPVTQVVVEKFRRQGFHL